MKKIISLILCAAMLAVFSSCGKSDADSDWDYIKNKGTLVIGITDFEPMNYYEGDTLTGFDTEFAEAVCKKLGVTAQFQEVNWSMKETELAGKTIDCIWNGFTVNDDLKENVEFTYKYMLNRQVVVIRKDDSTKYTDLASLSTASVAAESGSAGESVVKANQTLANCDYYEKDAQIDVLTELIGKTVDAGVLDYTMAYYLINKEGSSYSNLMILDDVKLSDEEYYAIGFRKGSDAVEKMNDIIMEMLQDGTIVDIAGKYGLNSAIVDMDTAKS